MLPLDTLICFGQSLMTMNKIKVAFLSSFPPRICGIGSFTRDLLKATQNNPRVESAKVVAINKKGKKENYGSEVIYSFNDSDLQDYSAAADYLNNSDFSVISLQHEYGLYAGEMGDFILEFIKNNKKPLVTTFHMISLKNEVTQHQLMVTREIALGSDAVVALSETGKKDLENVYKIPRGKIYVIHHGAPDISRNKSEEAKKKFGLTDKKIITTINIVRPSRGIDYVIKALPKIIKKNPNTIYLVLGTDPADSPKPNPFRKKLKEMVSSLNLGKYVKFDNRYIPMEELISYIQASDIFITPYRPPEQSSSGSLAYALVAGKVCVSTPYSYAKTLLGENRGKLVPWENSEAIADSIIELFSNPKEMETISQNAYNYGRQMTWKNVSQKYIQLFSDILNI